MLHKAHDDRLILQRTGAVTDAARFTLPRETKLFIDTGYTHVDLFDYWGEFAFNWLDSSAWADITTLHAQDAGFLSGADIGGAMGCNAIFTAEEFNTVIGADLGALITAYTLADKIIFRQRPWWANVSLSELLNLESCVSHRGFKAESNCGKYA